MNDALFNNARRLALAEAARNIRGDIWINGFAANYTGQTKVLHGGTFYGGSGAVQS
jgi:hypothetical protein